MKKRNVVTLSQLDLILRSGDVYIFNYALSKESNRYIFNLYDDSFKYVCEVQNLSSFDIRMLRRIYDNLYFYNDELEGLIRIFGQNNKNVNK